MINLINRYYLEIHNKKSLIKSNCTEKNLKVILVKKLKIDFIKFLYKEIGKDFLER